MNVKPRPMIEPSISDSTDSTIVMPAPASRNGR